MRVPIPRSDIGRDDRGAFPVRGSRCIKDGVRCARAGSQSDRMRDNEDFSLALTLVIPVSLSFSISLVPALHLSLDLSLSLRTRNLALRVHRLRCVIDWRARTGPAPFVALPYPTRRCIHLGHITV